MAFSKKDKRTGHPKIWIYRDKATNEPKGDPTVTYEDPHAALAAVEWFNNKNFHGATIGVLMAESKNKDYVANHGTDLALNTHVNDLEEQPRDANGGAGRGRHRGDAGGKPWQQDGDWLCTNTRSFKPESRSRRIPRIYSRRSPMETSKFLWINQFILRLNLFGSNFVILTSLSFVLIECPYLRFH